MKAIQDPVNQKTDEIAYYLLKNWLEGDFSIVHDTAA